MSIIKVFITYAHESDEFREKTKEFAIWLNSNGNGRIIVNIDHLFSYKAPREGWQVWMHNQVQDSDVVLVICTPKYLKRFNKREDAGQGKGVVFEGAIITTALYNYSGINEKFIPIIPEDGSSENIPVILQPYFNGLEFPKNNAHILKAIFDENPVLDEKKQEIAAEETDPKLILEDQIVEEIIKEKETNTTTMFSSVHALVRAFLELSDAHKLEIIKKLVFEKELQKIRPDERDRKFLQKIHEKKLLSELWDEINKIKPFNLKANPF